MSTIPTAQANLETLLQAATWPTIPEQPNGVQISWGTPKHRERVLVIIGDTFAEGDALQEWAALGHQSRQERYAIALNVIAIVPGKTQGQVTQLAFDVWDVIEAILIAHPQLDVSGTPVSTSFEAQARQPTHREKPEENGFSTEIVTAVLCSSRI